jgi:hypothetical protein
MMSLGWQEFPRERGFQRLRAGRKFDKGPPLSLT